MKKINNLNEEINRIKSLFTEERMFGNLVTEQPVDPNQPANSSPGTDKDVKDKDAEMQDKSTGTEIKKDKKDEFSEIKSEVKNNEKECQNHVWYMIKAVRGGTSRKEFDAGAGDVSEKDIPTLKYCIKTFEQRWSNPKDGKWWWQRGDELRRLFDTLNLEMPKWMSSRMKDTEEQEIDADVYDPEGGVTGGSGGKKIVVRHNKNKIAIINKKAQNLWTFRTPIKLKNMVSLIDKKDPGNIKFRDKYVSDIYRALNIDPNKYRIVIQKAFDSKGFDTGTFVLKEKQ